jgi:hypothetical protein
MNKKRTTSISDLYPDLSADQLERADAHIGRYVALIWRISERLKAEGKSWPPRPSSGDLTEPTKPGTIPTAKVDSPRRN